VLATLRRPGRGVFALLEGRAELEVELQRRRDLAANAAGAAIASARAQAVVIATATWLASRGVSVGEQERVGEERARAWARHVLGHRTDELLRGIERLAELDASARHQLRVQAKKVRYGAEFFSGAFPSAAHEGRVFVRRASRLQDALGQLSDVAVYRTLAVELGSTTAQHPMASPTVRFAMVVSSASEADRVDELVSRARHAGARLAKAARFWD